MADVRYAIGCRNKECGHIEDKAWSPETGETHSKRQDGTNGTPVVPLTPQGRVPLYCPKCGKRWWGQATKEQVEAFDARTARESRVAELLRHDDFEGLFKVPDEIRADALVKRALANLLGPLDGEVLKNAQANCRKVAQSGRAGDSSAWIEWYSQAVDRATANHKPTQRA